MYLCTNGLFNDASSSLVYMTAVTTTRLVNLQLKNKIIVGHMHTRLSGDNALKIVYKKGASYLLKLTFCSWVSWNKKPWNEEKNILLCSMNALIVPKLLRKVPLPKPV